MLQSAGFLKFGFYAGSVHAESKGLLINEKCKVSGAMDKGKTCSLLLLVVDSHTTLYPVRDGFFSAPVLLCPLVVEVAPCPAMGNACVKWRQIARAK